MGSGAMICIPSFVNIDSGVQTLIGWGYTDSKVISLTAKPTCLGPYSVSCVRTLKLNMSVRNTSRRRHVVIM
jgi:hypothetical protein